VVQCHHVAASSRVCGEGKEVPWRHHVASESPARGVTRRHIGAVNPPLLAFGAREGWAGAERNPLSLAFGAREGLATRKGVSDSAARKKKTINDYLLSRVWEGGGKKGPPLARV
jgi:hypothetical protein